ncbi:hypothetical protein GCM10025863_21800 [Microbacterium suwonense]|uniref:Glycosyltransferase 2-like domain-containing protein n=1 Tax=Microbacterium suwonense TaxID=683047 RepID=A0ABM8FV88_9MICO|nr:hypothetical protein GCM10025863_21800 [Microbacterium suwonense]
MSASVTVIVPTFNERDNVAELVSRTAAALAGREAEILFVDDSSDDTMAEIARVSASAPVPIRGIHREHNTAGLGGAVVVGLAEAAHDVCVVMDGDLQHPPELLPTMIARYERGMPMSSPPPATSAAEIRRAWGRPCAWACRRPRPQ